MRPTWAALGSAALLLSLVPMAMFVSPGGLSSHPSETVHLAAPGHVSQPILAHSSPRFVYAMIDDRLRRIGRVTELDARGVELHVYPQFQAETAGLATALLLPRTLQTLIAWRSGELEELMRPIVTRLGRKIEAATSQILSEPEVLESLIATAGNAVEEALESERVQEAQRRAIAKAIALSSNSALPEFRQVLRDVLLESLEDALTSLPNSFMALLKGGEIEVLSAERMTERIMSDPRIKEEAIVLLGALARDREVQRFLGLVVDEALKRALGQQTFGDIIRRVWSEEPYGSHVRTVAGTLEAELRSFAEALILTNDRSAIDPVAAIVLRGLIDRTSTTLLWLVPSRDSPLAGRLSVQALAVFNR